MEDNDINASQHSEPKNDADNLCSELDTDFPVNAKGRDVINSPERHRASSSHNGHTTNME